MYFDTVDTKSHIALLKKDVAELAKINIVLSFDHELSLGGVSGTYENNLFNPTRQILTEANNLGVKVTLFTDVLCSLRFRDWDQEGFVRPYEEQLRSACQSGHDVQLHLHPHWLDTTFDDGRFIQSSRYSLHEFREETSPNDIEGIVRRGTEYLTNVCRSAIDDYRCIAFRAGGLNMSPSTGDIIQALVKSGILIDSSVAPGYKFISNVNSVDYSNTPAEPNWHISTSCIDGNKSRLTGKPSLFEVPIVTIPRNPLNNIPALIRRVMYASRAPRTEGITLYDVDTGMVEKLKRLAPFSSWMLSFDYYWSDGSYLVAMLKTYLRQYVSNTDDEIYVSTLSHPKSMGPGGLTVMREFISQARSEFGDDIEFVTFPQIASRVMNSKIHE
jgi:hypothetical protein